MRRLAIKFGLVFFFCVLVCQTAYLMREFGGKGDGVDALLFVLFMVLSIASGYVVDRVLAR